MVLRYLHAGSEVKLLALDCEMVECVDNEEQIVQLCVADRDCKKLVDILVKPSRPVVDYRTPVHGITAQDLNRAAYCTQKDAQDKLVELLAPGTILVGHTLSHDLEILKISYPRVIDVGLLFKTNREATVGLNDLCKVILGFDMRGEDGRHDCFQDTVAAMKLALHELVRPTLGALDLAAINENKLLIHGIPASITAETLSNLFAIKCAVKHVRRGNGGFGSTVAEFNSKSDAQDAFNRLPGHCAKNARFGQDQKCVFVKGLTNVLIRKMDQ